jgi:hypothetical protein
MLYVHDVCLSMMHIHAACPRRMFMLNVHVAYHGGCPCYIHVLSECPCCMFMLHFNATCLYINMLHECCSSIPMPILHVRSCCMSIYVTCPRLCYIFMSALHVHVSMLHVHAQSPCSKSMPQVHAPSPCLVGISPATAASYYILMKQDHSLLS